MLFLNNFLRVRCGYNNIINNIFPLKKYENTILKNTLIHNNVTFCVTVVIKFEIK